MASHKNSTIHPKSFANCILCTQQSLLPVHVEQQKLIPAMAETALFRGEKSSSVTPKGQITYTRQKSLANKATNMPLRQSKEKDHVEPPQVGPPYPRDGEGLKINEDREKHCSVKTLIKGVLCPCAPQWTSGLGNQKAKKDHGLQKGHGRGQLNRKGDISNYF